MSKDSLVGKGLWESYSNKVKERMNNPQHRGTFSEEEANSKNLRLIEAEYGDAGCGDSIELYWLVDEATNTIKDAKFLSFGCGTAIASADAMVELTIGKSVEEAAAITNLDVEKALRDEPDKPAFPGQKMHCSVMAYDVIKRAVASYKGQNPEELDEQDVVCTCARVTLKDVVDAIKINDLKSVEDIVQYTKAGGYCKSCIRPGGHDEKPYYLEDILKETRESMAKG